MFLSCLSPCWCGSVWVAVLADGDPCAVSLIVVGSFILFTVGCGCTVNWVLCLLCGWIFHCVVCGIARHLYCWSGFFFYNAEFLLYRGRAVLYALCMWLLVLSVWWCILRCCMLPVGLEKRIVALLFKVSLCQSQIPGAFHVGFAVEPGQHVL